MSTEKGYRGNKLLKLVFVMNYGLNILSASKTM